MNCDVLVIGSGIAGLSYALELALEAPNLSIVLLSKRDVLESNTRYAQGGIAVVQDFTQDSFEKHVNDTLRAGDGLCNPEVVNRVVAEGPSRLRQLILWGTRFDEVAGSERQFQLGKEGGHSAHRIVHHKDKSGHEIQQSLITQLEAFSNIQLLENHILVDLITDHHHNQKHLNRCYGAYVLSKESLRILKINAQVTVLSTGGAGQVYDYSTNPESATGDGIAAAYRAKIRIKNLQYVQFHPTALAIKVDGSPFLISEAVRGAGAILRNAQGERFMVNYDQRAELASRDIVARAIEIEINKQKIPHVFLDVSHLPKSIMEDSFPTIRKACLKVGINPSQDWIPVRPAAHYFCGGIDVNLNAETSLYGLLAIGECSNTGLHGANRLASNSLLEALVYAHYGVGTTISQLNSENTIPKNYLDAIPDWSHATSIIDTDSEEVQALKKGVQEVMSKNVGVFKSTDGLLQAEQELEGYYLKAKALYNSKKLTPQVLELRNMVNVGYLIIKQSQEAKENRGGFYNKDYA
jgi:L-aspartate oxidase